MNRQEFTGYIQHPHSLHPGIKEELHTLAERYPYASSVQVLYTLILQVVNDHEVNFQLKKSAAYATSRKRLKELVEKIMIPEPEKVAVSLAQQVAEPVKASATGKDELMERVRKRLGEIEAERYIRISSEPSGEFVQVTGTEGDHASDLLSKAEIIEKFIHEEPRISPPRTSFFKPSEYALRSNIDETEIVSETLGRLYLEQGNLVKARMVYEKLCLLFPEKSSYFAAQIEKTGND
ncbi:MAG: hypothetical protein NTW10_05020 [Bacteroidetes bacterium]|nr:hypothetical protein [Bacteroidota bacterium]